MATAQVGCPQLVQVFGGRGRSAQAGQEGLRAMRSPVTGPVTVFVTVTPWCLRSARQSGPGRVTSAGGATSPSQVGGISSRPFDRRRKGMPAEKRRRNGPAAQLCLPGSNAISRTGAPGRPWGRLGSGPFSHWSSLIPAAQGPGHPATRPMVHPGSPISATIFKLRPGCPQQGQRRGPDDVRASSVVAGAGFEPATSGL